MATKKSIDKLIEIAKAGHKDLPAIEDDETGAYFDYLNEAEKFKEVFQLKEGNHKVYSTALYAAYKSWAEEPAKAKSFGMLFSKIFQGTTGAKNRVYYMLNKSPGMIMKKAKMLNDQEEATDEDEKENE